MTVLVRMAVLAALVGAPLPAVAAVEAAPASYVADRAGILDAETNRRLTGLLQECEQKTGARIIVLTVRTTGGQDIHHYAFQRADAWTFGADRQSASALLVIAVDDRKYRTEVGYEWESVLTDGFVGQAGRDYLEPHFRAGRMSRGVLEMAAALAQKAADSKGVTLSGMPTLRRADRPQGAVCCMWGVMMLMILLATIFGRGHHRGMLFWGLLAGSMMGGRRGGFGRGGFGGGGFGGFGGGGGGGFGGGGAGGSW